MPVPKHATAFSHKTQSIWPAERHIMERPRPTARRVLHGRSERRGVTRARLEARRWLVRVIRQPPIGHGACPLVEH
eukprot:2910338-Prymnesium_polylepis.1